MKVSHDRWLEAQDYERRTWTEGSGADMASDRNIQHAQRFNCYEVLDSVGFPRGIELGCGPFTNMRFVEPACAEIEEVHLLDPLMPSYLNHDWCRYADDLEAYKHSCPIEYFEWPKKFDLVVMVNVLAHCRDSDAVFAKILEILQPHGVLVFHEYTRIGEFEERDPGHPLMVPVADFEAFIGDNFDCKMADEYHDLEGQKGRRDWYVIGQRKP